MFEDKNVLHIRISSVVKFISIITGILVLLSVGMNVFYYTYHDLGYFNSLFSLDMEGNIPTRFSSGLLVAASLLFLMIYRVKKRTDKKYVIHWLILSIVFALMGLDESVQLHEQTSQFLRSYVKGLHFAWVIPGSLMVIIFAITYLKFFLNLDPRWKKLFFLSAVIYLSGALGMEIIGNYYQNGYGQNNLGYIFITNIEETLEFCGLIMLLYSQSSYLKELGPVYQVNMKK